MKIWLNLENRRYCGMIGTFDTDVILTAYKQNARKA